MSGLSLLACFTWLKRLSLHLWIWSLSDALLVLLGSKELGVPGYSLDLRWLRSCCKGISSEHDEFAIKHIEIYVDLRITIFFCT